MRYFAGIHSLWKQFFFFLSAGKFCPKHFEFAHILSVQSFRLGYTGGK